MKNNVEKTGSNMIKERKNCVKNESKNFPEIDQLNY